MPNSRLKQIMIGVLMIIGIGFVVYVPAANRRGKETSIQLPEVKQSTVERVDHGETYQLEAKQVTKNINGQEVKMLAYNGSIPGPTIEVEQDSTIKIHFTNNSDIATTIHPHGVRVANANDGVPDVTQKLVDIGESFTYELTFPDAGVYWYHPHFREDYAQELGLYGNFLVKPKDQNYWSEVNGEQVVFLDDILLGNGEPSFDQETADHTLMGRFGNTMLVNGETDYRLQVPAGAVERFYFTNAANTRPFNVEIAGAKMKLVGGDNGKYEREAFVDSVLLGPSERAIVEVYFPKAGPYQLLHKTPEKTYQLGMIEAGADSSSPSFVKGFETLRTNNDVIASIDPFRQDFNRAPDKTLRLTLDMQHTMGGSMHHMHGGMSMTDSQMMMGTPAGGIEWEDQMAEMNATSTTKTLTWKLVDTTSGDANMNIDDWNFKVGERVKVRIINDPHSMHPMQHPIHFHGQRFLVLSRDGQKEENMVWKDTTFIPAGQTVDVLIEMSNPGTWMAHCHIAEHLEAGMMLEYRVQ